MKYLSIVLVFCIISNCSLSAMEEEIIIRNNKGMSELKDLIHKGFKEGHSSLEIEAKINNNPFSIQLYKAPDATYTGIIFFDTIETASKSGLSSVYETLEFIRDTFQDNGY